MTDQDLQHKMEENNDCDNDCKKLIMNELSNDYDNIKIAQKPKTSQDNKKTKKKQINGALIKKSLEYVAKKHRTFTVIENDEQNIDLFFEKTEKLKQDLCFCAECKEELVMLEYFPVCLHCGYIDENIIDHSPEWKSHGADDKIQTDISRCGNPINPLLEQFSYAMKVRVNYKSTMEMKTIKKWTDWGGNPNNEKMLNDEFQYITQVALRAGITKNIIDRALEIYKMTLNHQMFRGENREGIRSASIYVSCKENGVPRTPQEIATMFNIDKKYATIGLSTIKDIMLQIEKNNKTDNNDADTTEEITSITIDTDNCIHYIPRFCSLLEMKDGHKFLCMCIAEKIDADKLITDHASHCIASGIIYFVAVYYKVNITKQMIENCTGISDVTINKCFQKIEIYKDLLKAYIIAKVREKK